MKAMLPAPLAQIPKDQLKNVRLGLRTILGEAIHVNLRMPSKAEQRKAIMLKFIAGGLMLMGDPPTASRGLHLIVDGCTDSGITDSGITYSSYPVRSPWHDLVKNVNEYLSDSATTKGTI